MQESVEITETGKNDAENNPLGSILVPNNKFVTSNIS